MAATSDDERVEDINCTCDPCHDVDDEVYTDAKRTTSHSNSDTSLTDNVYHAGDTPTTLPSSHFLQCLCPMNHYRFRSPSSSSILSHDVYPPKSYDRPNTYRSNAQYLSPLEHHLCTSRLQNTASGAPAKQLARDALHIPRRKPIEKCYSFALRAKQ